MKAVLEDSRRNEDQGIIDDPQRPADSVEFVSVGDNTRHRLAQTDEMKKHVQGPTLLNSNSDEQIHYMEDSCAGEAAGRLQPVEWVFLVEEAEGERKEGGLLTDLWVECLMVHRSVKRHMHHYAVEDHCLQPIEMVQNHVLEVLVPAKR